MKATPEQQASYDKLFAEPFTPQWMLRKRQALAHAVFEMDNAKRFDVDTAYRREALRSRLRIATRCNGYKYTNS
jgi:hypothetical protein